ASACQPYHALVSTPDGLIPIGRLVEEQAVGVKVFDASGVTRIVAGKHNGQKPVLRVHTEAGHELDVTADHLVWRCSGETSGEEPSDEGASGAFVLAGELRPGDTLEWCDVESFGSAPHDQTEVTSIEELGEMDVYDIQT